MTHTHTISPVALRSVCPALTGTRSVILARDLGTALHRFYPGGIGPNAAAHFIAQCAHESGQFAFPRELWGPSTAQKRYWRRRDLQGPGILFPGLGFRYRGGGWIQTTGRANFRVAAKRLGFKSCRRLAAQADSGLIASLLAVEWWQRHFPSAMPKSRFSVIRVSRIVNLGNDKTTATPNGLAERSRFFERARLVRTGLVPVKLP